MYETHGDSEANDYIVRAVRDCVDRLTRIGMIKGSVFAGKKGPAGNGYGTPVNSSSTSSSLFDNSLQQHNPFGVARNWQATPTNSRRLGGVQHHHPLLHPSNSTASLRGQVMPPAGAILNTPSARAKPYTLQGLVENLNEVRKTI